MKPLRFMVAASLSLLAGAARADDWGCQVLLCLSNPAGPMAVAECVPPISRLWRALAHGDAFPTCALASSPDGDSYAQPGNGAYDRCPEGTQALGEGVRAVQMSPDTYAAASGATAAFYGSAQAVAIAGELADTRVHVGIGEGDGVSPSGIGDGPMPEKTCVSGPLGPVLIPGDIEQGAIQGQAFSQVMSLPAQAMTGYIDVFISGKFQHRVRY